MTLITEFTKTEYLGDTQVENIFLGEYMTTAPGDYVKVYLYGLMKAQRKEEADTESIAKALHMSEDQVEKGFRYFEELGLILRRGRTLIYRSLKEQLYGHPEEDAYWDTAEGEDDAASAKGTEDAASREKAGRLLDNQAVAKMVSDIQDITGDFLTAADQERIIDWITGLGVDPGLITAAYRYSYQRGGKNAKYIGKVILGWAEEGLVTADDAEEYLQDRDERRHIYRRVMKALGFNRRPTEEEARLISKWVDDLGLSLNDILEACKKTIGIGNPNIKYVDAVVRGKKEDESRGPARSVVLAYYEVLRKEAEDRARKARETVYEAVPAIRGIDEESVRLSRAMTGSLLGGGVDKADELAGIRRRLDDLEQQKTRLLTEHNVPVDYATPRYRCRICQDTGITDGGLCVCYAERAKEAALWEQEQKA